MGKNKRLVMIFHFLLFHCPDGRNLLHGLLAIFSRAERMISSITFSTSSRPPQLDTQTDANVELTTAWGKLVLFTRCVAAPPSRRTVVIRRP